MSTVLRRLLGLSVLHAGPSEDGFHVRFSDGSNLSIFNRYAFAEGLTVPSEIVGAQLSAVEEQQEKVIFGFSSGHQLEVDMTDAGFTGPEALELKSPNHPIVVWQ